MLVRNLKLLFILTLLLCLSFTHISSAKTKVNSYIDNEFFTLAKKGKLKGVPGQIGMSFSNVKKLVKNGKVDLSESYDWYNTKNYSYAFIPHNNQSRPNIKTNDKVAMISHSIPPTSEEIFKNTFGKSVATDVYRAGNYYIRVEKYQSTKVTSILLGTKEATNMWFTAPESGDLIP